MITTRTKMLLMAGLSAIVILIVADRMLTQGDAFVPHRAQADSSKSASDGQVRREGLQWLGELPAAKANERRFGDVVAALAATRDGADALVAYEIIEGCEMNRPIFEMASMPPVFLERKKQCATITDAMRRSRYDYLRAAAFAGTPGVGSPWLRYGPSGDMEALRTTPNDPSVIEWKRQASELVIRDGDQGDINALQDLMDGYSGKSPVFEADPSRQLAYAMAYKDIVDQLNLVGVQNQPTDAELEALAANLPPDQVAWAKAKAAAIAAASAKRARAGNR